MKKLEEYNGFVIEDEKQIALYYGIRQQLEALALQFRSFITKSKYLLPFLQPGRLIKVANFAVAFTEKFFR